MVNLGKKSLKYNNFGVKIFNCNKSGIVKDLVIITRDASILLVWHVSARRDEGNRNPKQTKNWTNSRTHLLVNGRKMVKVLNMRKVARYFHVWLKKTVVLNSWVSMSSLFYYFIKILNDWLFQIIEITVNFANSAIHLNTNFLFSDKLKSNIFSCKNSDKSFSKKLNKN